MVDAIEARIERQDGTIGWVQVSAAPVFRADGTVEVAVAAIVDVTAEKAAWAAAEEAGRAKDEFVAMLGHELRNPLAPIVTALDLMRLRGAGVLEQERAVIERQAQHLVRLVDDLLDVSRSVREGLRLERAPVELSVAVADAIEVAGPLVEGRHQRLAVSVPAAGLVVEADRGRLAQVVTNLLTNAAKYTPQGGHVTVSARAEGEQVTLEVADDGAGIAPDLLRRIFNPFTQGRQGLDRKQGGLGLGLAIARRLVDGHDGTIEARSEGPGRGTTMIVRLPRARAPSTEQAPPRDVAKARPRHAARRVLIVDDNPDAAAHARGGDCRSGARGAHGRRRPQRARARRDLPARHRLARHRPSGDGRVRAGRPAPANPEPPRTCSLPSLATPKTAIDSARWPAVSMSTSRSRSLSGACWTSSSTSRRVRDN